MTDHPYGRGLVSTAEPEWKCDDMALASYLSMEGNEIIKFHWELGSCFFVFTETDDLLDAVNDFVGGYARVDPRKYNMTFAQIKRRMFASKPERTAAAT